LHRGVVVALVPRVEYYFIMNRVCFPVARLGTNAHTTNTHSLFRRRREEEQEQQGLIVIRLPVHNKSNNTINLSITQISKDID